MGQGGVIFSYFGHSSDVASVDF